MGTEKETKRQFIFMITAILALFSACNDSGDDDAAKPPVCSGLAGQPGSYLEDIDTPDGIRTYRLTVPNGYEPDRGAPVVFNFHGWMSDAERQDSITRMPEKAQAEGFIAVTPQGYGQPASWNGGTCCPPANLESDDVAYTRLLVDRLEEDYCIDRSRIYATGMSNGGFMSNRLGCDASDLIAAIAPVSSVLGVPDCDPDHTVPIMMFNGNADSLLNYDGKDSLLENFPSVPGSFQKWAEFNECKGPAQTTYTNGEVTCESYTDCKAETILCTIEGGGHTWPGGVGESQFGHKTNDISATDAMWEFFSKQVRK